MDLAGRLIDDSLVDHVEDAHGKVHKGGDVFDVRPDFVELVKQKYGPRLTHFENRRTCKSFPNSHVTPGEYEYGTAKLTIRRNTTHLLCRLKFYSYEDWNILRHSIFEKLSDEYLVNKYHEDPHEVPPTPLSFEIAPPAKIVPMRERRRRG